MQGNDAMNPIVSVVRACDQWITPKSLEKVIVIQPPHRRTAEDALSSTSIRHCFNVVKQGLVKEGRNQLIQQASSMLAMPAQADSMLTDGFLLEAGAPAGRVSATRINGTMTVHGAASRTADSWYKEPVRARDKHHVEQGLGKCHVYKEANLFQRVLLSDFQVALVYSSEHTPPRPLPAAHSTHAWLHGVQMSCAF